MLEITKLSSDLAPALRRFFAAIDCPEIRVHFSPHAFTAEIADLRCGYRGLDEYYVLLQEGEILGYGMLRGWDEGFKKPSLGICLLPGQTSRGLGTLLMQHLIAAANLRKAPAILLRVKRDNQPAIALYKRFGFQLEPQDDFFFKGVLELGFSPVQRKAR